MKKQYGYRKKTTICYSEALEITKKDVSSMCNTNILQLQILRAILPEVTTF